MKKGLAIFIVLILILGGGYFGYTKYTEGKRIEAMEEALKGDDIYTGITIDGIDVSGLSKEEAKDKILTAKADELEGKNFNINVEDKNYTFELKNLDHKMDIDKAISEAYEYAREGELEERYNKLEALKDNPLNIVIDKEIDYSHVDDFVAKIASEIDTKAVNAEFSVNNGKITSTESKDGKKLDTEKLKNDILDAINNSAETITASVKTIEPEKKHSDLERINGLIGSFTTDISTSSNERKTNIRVSSKSVSKKLLLPGESFNFNNAIGDITAANGYKNAHVLKGGEYENGLGGGMCQTSTTLYNALVRAGVKILERHPHSRAANYVPKGQDCAVWKGSKNLRFQNSYDFPIYIDSSVTNNKVTFYVYGDKTKKDYDISFKSEIVEVIKSETIEKEDPSLKAGERIVDVKGYDGYRVVTNKIVTKDGKVISNKQFAKNYYPKRDTIARVSTKTAGEEDPSGDASNSDDAVMLPW